MENNKVAYEVEQENRRIGKAPSKSHPLMLSAANYLGKAIVIPEVFNYWSKRKKLPSDIDYGNDNNGDCTFASQAVMALKMELQERRRLISIDTDEILRVYYNLTKRLYGGGDTGAYELDALSNWRNADLTFRDTKRNPLTIDAYTKVNHSIISEVKKAIFLSAAKGVKVCFNMPIAWANTLTWDIPEKQLPIGKYLPGSWGGHSMASAEGYDKDWCYLNHTWTGCGVGKISWKAFAIYCDESYMVIDSVNSWKKKLSKTDFKASALISDVNNVSDIKIK